MIKPLTPKKEKIFNYGVFLLIVLGLIITLLIDTSVVKIYDIVDKYFIPTHEKKVLFSVNTTMSLFFQYLLIRYVRSIFNNQINRLKAGFFYKTMVISLSVTSILFAYIFFQLFYTSYYFSFSVILIIVISYGTAVLFVFHGIFMDPHLKNEQPDFFDGEKLLLECCGLLLIAASVLRYRYHLKKERIA